MRHQVLLPALLAWPAVVALGALLNWWSASPAPMATLPMVWLLAVAWLIERFGANDGLVNK
ncbi:MAG TPA: hypothetical protein VF624_12115 [Tepidisphaeraceae bacterium]